MSKVRSSAGLSCTAFYITFKKTCIEEKCWFWISILLFTFNIVWTEFDTPQGWHVVKFAFDVCISLFCICAGVDFVDFTWEKVYFSIWKEFWNLHLLMTEFDCPEVTLCGKLQALVYDILPSTTAVFSNAIGSRKLSANEQFFVGAQTVVSLLQTTQILSDVCFITDQVAHASSNWTGIVWIKTEILFFFFYLGWMRLMFTCMLWC